MNRLLILLLALPLLASPASARPAYRRALVDLLELPSSSRLNDCRTCHLAPKPGADENDRPHNPFGARLKAVRTILRKADKPTDIAARLLHVAAEDSDKDGVANLHELLAGTFPGDGKDAPDADAVAAARKKQVALLEALKGYRWRPFERVSRPAFPAVRDPAWGRNPIDLFVLAEQQKRSLTPRPEAPRATLLRRVTIDLTGLPPSPEEVEAFLADTTATAYEKAVDRLLSSPRYGERWGRHWMDVWRYSDWAGWGAQVRDSQPHIWHWRDWIVESLNAGKGYDRMVLEMLAADELAPTDCDALRATGLLVRNYKLLSREKWMQDTVDHTGQAFLGLTIGCARCHDHMYDAVTQKEYYQFRAIFTPHNVRTDRLPGWPDVKKNGLPRAYDANPGATTVLFHRGDDRAPDKTPLQPGVPEALGGKFAPVSVTLPREAYDPDGRPFVLRELVEASLDAYVKLGQNYRRVIRPRLIQTALIDANPLSQVVRLAAVAEAQEAAARAKLDYAIARDKWRSWRAVEQAELRRDDPTRPGEDWKVVAKEANRLQRELAVLEAKRSRDAPQRALRLAPVARRKALQQQLAKAESALTKAEAALKAPPSIGYSLPPRKVYPTTSTGRRLALAKWITHRDNPLAARVAVNHVWARHFGTALVPNTFDFGKNGEAPSHPALVDWLAAELMDNGWSLKHLHRLIVTSATYRQASTPDRGNLERDPDNVYLWRFAPRRVEAEVVRDAIFFAAGRLDGKMGGPDIPHAQGLTVPRRSVYFQHAAEKQMEMMRIFDGASVTECYQRKQAILPQQSLALINNEMALRHARLTARLLDKRHGEPGKFVTAAFERLLSRPPSAAERATCLEFLQEQSGAFTRANGALDATGERPAPVPALRARENLVHVLLNHHEFVTLR